MICGAGSAWVACGAHENPLAYVWERRLHWVMIVVALWRCRPSILKRCNARCRCSISVGRWIFSSLSLLAWKRRGCCTSAIDKTVYLKYNWLNVLIIGASALGLVGLPSEWLPLVRLLRVAYVALILARMLTSVRILFSTNAIPYAFTLGLVTLISAGAGFYWLEPTIHSFGEGLWLAFTTGATVGYGDYVPTTPISRAFAVVMVIVGFTVFSLVTASVSALFVGEDEKRLRREMHQNVQELRREIAEMRAELQRHGMIGQDAPVDAAKKLPANEEI